MDCSCDMCWRQSRTYTFNYWRVWAEGKLSRWFSCLMGGSASDNLHFTLPWIMVSNSMEFFSGLWFVGRIVPSKPQTTKMKTIINNYWAMLSKIPLLVIGEQINNYYLPKPKAEANNNWSGRQWQITIFCNNQVQ